MSLQPIPNQPVGFVPTRLQGALCGADPEEVLLVSDGDTLGFQFRFNTCDNAGEIGDPTFIAPDDWRNLGGWVFENGTVCKASGSSALSLEYALWNPDPGTRYQLTVIVTSLSGLPTEVNYIQWRLGGESGFIFAPGTYVFDVLAISGQRLSFTASSAGTSACLSLAQVAVLDPDNAVTIVDLDGDTIQEYTFATDPDLFDYSGGFLTVRLPVDDAWGNCFRVKVDDPCAEVEYTSQIAKFINPAKTIKVRTCNSGPGMGFGAGFAPEARYIAKLVRSTFDYEEGVERSTTGKINRYYAERMRSMEFRVDDAGEIAHDFLSTFPLWDHVYLGQEEYSFKAEGFEPDYGDIWEAHGSIIMPVEPQRENMRKVRCAPDDQGGCVPPPNYLVQGTGPNTNYITLNSGGRIKLHE